MRTFCASALGAALCAASVQAFATGRNSGIKTDIESTAIHYFMDNANPKTGLVRDRAANFDTPVGGERIASIAATGFGLAVINNAAVRGLVSRKFAHDYNLKVLRFCRDSVARHKGWFLHFIDWESGQRAYQSEYSTIDTALFIAGALYAGQVFPASEISRIAHRLYQDIDFNDVMTDGGAQPQKRTISMAYTAEDGYTPAQWNMYAEQKLLLLLGLGHPTHPLPAESWSAWSRDTSQIQGAGTIMGYKQALFVHQYSDLYVDFRQLHDGFSDYFTNSSKVSQLHRSMVDPKSQYKTFREGFWGLSAGESPDGYAVWDPVLINGTVCIGCAIASTMFIKGILDDATTWKKSAYPVWGKYGFIDSLNLDRGWFSKAVLGITVGPAYMSLANLNPGTSIWNLFMTVPEIQRALSVAQGSK